MNVPAVVAGATYDAVCSPPQDPREVRDAVVADPRAPTATTSRRTSPRNTRRRPGSHDRPPPLPSIVRRRVRWRTYRR